MRSLDYGGEGGGGITTAESPSLGTEIEEAGGGRAPLCQFNLAALT